METKRITQKDTGCYNILLISYGMQRIQAGLRMK